MQPNTMSRHGRRGFTLIELLIALVLLGLVSAAVYRVLVNNQRVYMAQTQRIDLSQNIRAAVSILPAELREIDALDGDILAMGPTFIEVRAMRWTGFLCVPPVLGGGVNPINNVTMVLRGGAPGTPLFFGARPINIATDTMMIFYDGNRTIMIDDFWARGTFLGLQPVAQACPAVAPNGPAQPGVRITMKLDFAPSGGAANFANAITVGAPVRGWERVRYELYQQPGDTSWYIGFKPGNGTMQPLVGPLVANGMSFAYFNSAGAVTAVPNQVARIDMTVRVRTRMVVRTHGNPKPRAIVDSMTTSVALRNNRRF
jgi:prepilin-type N-terminal cleavage/methylation domain-containing protein